MQNELSSWNEQWSIIIERKVSTHTTGQLYHWASPVNIDFVIVKSLLQDIEFSVRLISPMNASFLTNHWKSRFRLFNKKARPVNRDEVTLICETKQNEKKFFCEINSNW